MMATAGRSPTRDPHDRARRDLRLSRPAPNPPGSVLELRDPLRPAPECPR